MNKEKIKKIFTIIIAVYALIAVSFYFVGGNELQYEEPSYIIEMPEANGVTDEITRGTTIEQKFVNTADIINDIEIVFTRFYRDGKGTVVIDLLDGSYLLVRKTMRVNDIPEQHRVYLEPKNPLNNVKDKELTIKIYSNSATNSGVALMMSQQTNEDSIIKIKDKEVKGTICFSLIGTNEIKAFNYYWLIMGAVGIVLGIYLSISYKSFVNNKPNYLIRAILAISNYSFLINQLVSRDFKSKYKRSVLGIFWSFLNPLLTMIVQFLVFSTFFKADTKNYPVYLLSGVICFNFFKECTDMCLISISGNSQLINKVYVPKYIFPLSKTLSSAINLGLSLIPLLLISLLMGIQIKSSVILIIYFLLCLIVFSLGVGLFLSALMVFFRDIQFLWTVLAQVWQYATPIFYPAEIIPDRYRFIVRFNPLYHFIGNMRKCLMDGISPEPSAYLYCLLFALISLFIGSYLFKKTQDKFTLYL